MWAVFHSNDIWTSNQSKDSTTKVWRHKNEISEILVFVRIFWKNIVQKIRRVCMEFSEYNRLTYQRQFAPKCSFLASRPLGHCSFRISWQIPQFQKFHFYDVITLVLYLVTPEGYLAQQEPLQNLRKFFNNATIHKN